LSICQKCRTVAQPFCSYPLHNSALFSSLTDSEILAYPYWIYEVDRLQQDAIAFALIDRGLFPPKALRTVAID